MKINVSEITDVQYAVGEVSCEPTLEEIKKAIKDNDLETRGFQDHLDILNREWNDKAKNEDEYFALQRDYHRRRIAFFMVNCWDFPILLYKDLHTIKDGLHRFKAAKYLGLEMIEVEVALD